MQDIAKIQSYYDSSETFPVPFNEFWEWVGYSTKQMAEKCLNANFKPDSDFQEVFNLKIKNPKGGRPAKDLRLTIDCAKCFAMLAQTKVGKQVRDYFIECEKKLGQASHAITALRHAVGVLEDHESRITDLETRVSLEHWAGKDSVPHRPELEAWKETHARNWNKRKEVIRLVGMYARQNNLSRREVYLLVFDEVKTCLQADIYREAFDGSTLEWLFTNDYIALTLDCANALFTKGGAR